MTESKAFEIGKRKTTHSTRDIPKGVGAGLIAVLFEIGKRPDATRI